MPRPRKNANQDEIADIFDDVAIDLSRAIGPQVYDLLRLKIIFSELPPGTKINEHELASRLGISRTPVREAYQKLADDNLIVSRPQVGSVVAPLDDERVSEGIVIRRALEIEVIKRLCAQGGDLQRIEPVLALQRIAVEQDDYFTFFNVDEQFHAMLAELAGIPSAWRLAHSVKAHADIARLSLSCSIPGRIKVAFNEHLRLIEAIDERNTASAQSIIIAHINSVTEIIGKHATIHKN